MRFYPRVAFEHLHERVLDREAEHLVAFFPQHIGDRFEHTRLPGPGYALHGHGPIARSQDKPGSAQLAFVQFEALIDESGCLDAGVGPPFGEDRFDRALAFICPGEDARLALDFLAAGQPSLVFALAP